MDIRKEQGQLEQAFLLLKKKVQQGAKLPLDKVAFIKSIPAKLNAYEEEMNQLLDEYLNLKEELDEMNNGSIVIQNMVYPGVKMLFSNLVYYVRKEEHHIRFFKSDGEVKSAYL